MATLSDRAQQAVESDAAMEKELPKMPDSNTRHYWVIVLFLFYAALSIVSWTLTCIISSRPLNFPSYYNQAGNFTPEQYQINDRWREATVVLRTLSATIALPITTAIASQAAVVYTQRKKGLSLRQMLAIADRGWTDIGVLLACINPAMARLIWTPFLLFVLSLTLIGVIIQPRPSWGSWTGYAQECFILLVKQWRPSLRSSGPFWDLGLDRVFILE